MTRGQFATIYPEEGKKWIHAFLKGVILYKGQLH